MNTPYYKTASAGGLRPFAYAALRRCGTECLASFEASYTNHKKMNIPYY